MKIRRIILGLCCTLTLLCAGGALLFAVFFSQINHQIKNFVLTELQQRYPNLDFQIGNVEIEESKRIILHNVDVRIAQGRQLFHSSEIEIICPLTLQTLYNKQVCIDKIIVRSPILRLTRSVNGTFDELTTLLQTTSTPLVNVPNIEIENASLIYEDKAVNAEPIKITDIVCQFEKASEKSTSTDQQQSTLSTLYRISATSESEHFRRLALQGEIDTQTKNWSIAVQCKQLELNDELTKYFLPNHFSKIAGSIYGRIDCHLSAVSAPDTMFGCQFNAEGTLSQGRIDIPNLNRTVSEMNASFTVNNDGFHIDKLTGIGESARFAVSYQQTGLLQRTAAELTANFRGLIFDEKLINAISPFLTPATLNILGKFDYTGTVDLHTEITYQNNGWLPKNVSLQASDATFTYKDFPYQLEHLTGCIFVDQKALLNFRFVSKPDSLMKVAIEGHYQNIFVDAAGKVEITGENVPIDQKLINSLPESTQRVADSLHPVGKLDARLVFVLPPDDVPLQKEFSISLNKVSVLYDKFPYPVSNLTGMMIYSNDAWRFENIAGSNGTAVFQCLGSLTNETLFLNVLASQLPVDEQLKDAVLEDKKRQLMQTLNIRGSMKVAAQIAYHLANQHLDLSFQAVPLAGVSVCPDKFPYQIDNLSGEIRYVNGNVHSDCLSGNNGGTKLQTAFDCQFNLPAPILQLSNLSLDQVSANRELQDALPKELRSVIETLQITEPINIAGGITFHTAPQSNEIESRFDLAFIFHRNTVRFAYPVENLFGQMRICGQSNSNGLRLSGAMNFDAFTVNQLPVTDLRGSFFYDGKQIQLGVPANHLTPNIPAQLITAKFFDGILTSEGLVVIRDGFSYSINANLEGADLAKIARQLNPTSRKTEGTLGCTNLNVRGTGSKLETIAATGKIELRDANIYEAPGMMRLLRELSIREVDPNAGVFRSADINFRLLGRQIYFSPLAFEGSLFSLYGDGVMQLDSRNIDLTMRTRLGNRRTQIPLISDIIGGVGDQIVQLKISGPVANPTVSRVALPEIQKNLQQFQIDTQAEASTPMAQQPPQSNRPLQWKPL